MSTEPRVAVIAGASGLVGRALLDVLLADPRIGRVVSVGRRSLDVKHEKLEQRVVDLAAGWPALAHIEEAIGKGVDDAYCCLGTTIKAAGSKQAFLAVDVDAVRAFAKAARQQGARRFIVVSSLGADSRSVNFYLRAKGDMERLTKEIGFDAWHSVRPSVLDGARKEERAAERFSIAAMSAVGKLWPSFRYKPTPATTVAKAMVKLAFDDAPGAFVHDAPELHRLGA